jgi:hypothetical protein
MRYRVNAYAKRTRHLTETEPTENRSAAVSEGLKMKATGKYKVITVLRDSEGKDHPANAGKFFLDQIIK